MVYFLENQKLSALKLGVGPWGRINEFLEARIEPSSSSENIGWKLLRAAKFSTTESQYDEGREQAYEAERRAHFYWRYVKRYSIHLTREQMGYSVMNVEGFPRYGSTKGYTETAQLGEVCEATTWNFVIRSPGFKEEFIPQGVRSLIQKDFENISLDTPPGYLEADIKRIRHSSVDGARTDATEEERIWAKVNKTESCWFWTAAKTPTGYGFGVFEGKGGPAHRIVWKLEIGSDPGLYILDNVCGTRSCVNPMHWSLSKETF